MVHKQENGYKLRVEAVHSVLIRFVKDSMPGVVFKWCARLVWFPYEDFK